MMRLFCFVAMTFIVQLICQINFYFRREQKNIMLSKSAADQLLFFYHNLYRLIISYFVHQNVLYHKFLKNGSFSASLSKSFAFISFPSSLSLCMCVGDCVFVFVFIINVNLHLHRNGSKLMLTNLL